MRPTVENFEVDKAILEALPQGSRLVGAEQYAHSDWASTAKLTVNTSEGLPLKFFLKIVDGPDAEKRVAGEFASMTEIYKTMPSLVPQPRGYGKCSGSGGFYFLCDFKEMDHGDPDPAKLGKCISALHRESMGKSPTGKFGTGTVPYDGKLPLLGEWDDSWLSYFTKLMRLSYQHARDAAIHSQGHEQQQEEEELDALMGVVVGRLIPRLLGPLEGTIQPCLIHGDLWEANTGTDKDSGEMYIFDAAAYWAHSEKELGIWRCEHHETMNREEYLTQYFAHRGQRDEPVEEFRDRQLLYSVQTKLMQCGHKPERTEVRSQLVGDLRYLVEKYVDANPAS